MNSESQLPGAPTSNSAQVWWSPSILAQLRPSCSRDQGREVLCVQHFARQDMAKGTTVAPDQLVKWCHVCTANCSDKPSGLLGNPYVGAQCTSMQRCCLPLFKAPACVPAGFAIAALCAVADAAVHPTPPHKFALQQHTAHLAHGKTRPHAQPFQFAAAAAAAVLARQAAGHLYRLVIPAAVEHPVHADATADTAVAEHLHHRWHRYYWPLTAVTCAAWGVSCLQVCEQHLEEIWSVIFQV